MGIAQFQTMPAKPSGGSRKIAIVVVVVILVVIVAAVVAFSSGIGIVQTKTVTTTATSTTTTLSQTSANVVNALVTVGARNYEDYQINVPQGATSVTVSGSFTASGGSGNDIEVIVLDSTSFVNWQNGHQVSAYYDSGQVTTNNFNIQLPGSGTYYLVYNNQFSLLSSKNVNTQVNVNYLIPVQTVVTYTTSYLTS